MKYLYSCAQLWWLVLALLTLWIYWPVLKSQPVLGRDDLQVLSLLPSEISLHSLQELWSPKVNPDLQPLKELSLLLDLKIGKLLHYRVFHISNLCLFWLSLCILHQLLQSLCKDIWLVRGLVLLTAVHPLAVMSVAWIAARKYLLAALFLLLATKFFTEAFWRARPYRSIALATFSFLFALASQPVAVVWPLWTCAYLYDQRKFKKSSYLFWLACIGNLCLGFAWTLLQTKHYAAYFVQNHLLSRQEQLGGFRPLGNLALALGRATWQLLVPLAYSVTYSPSSWRNYAGLVLLVALLAYFIYSKNFSKIMHWLLWGAAALLITLVKVQNLFFSDTYAFLMLFALALVFSIAVYCQTQAARRNLLIVLTCLVPIFAWQARAQSYQWLDDISLWRQAYHQEPDCFDSLAFVSQLYMKEQFTEASDVNRYHLRNCRDSLMAPLIALGVFYEVRLNTEDKQKILQNIPGDSKLPQTMRTALYLAEKNYVAASSVWKEKAINATEFASLQAFEQTPLRRAVAEACNPSERIAICIALKTMLDAAPLPEDALVKLRSTL